MLSTSETSYIREDDYIYSNQILFRADPFPWDVNPNSSAVCLNGERIPRSLEDPWLQPPKLINRIEHNSSFYQKLAKSLLLFLTTHKSLSFNTYPINDRWARPPLERAESRAGNRLRVSWSGKTASRFASFLCFLFFLLSFLG